MPTPPTRAYHQDLSYPPVQEGRLSYIRGDGARVEITIAPPAGTTLHTAELPARQIITVGPSPAPAVRKASILDLFEDAPSQRSIYTPLTAADLPPQVITPVAAQLAPDAGIEARQGLPGHVATGTYDTDVFDHAAIGGKYTVFVLLYGPKQFHPLHRRCLNAIITTIPTGRMDLRIGSNALCQESVDFVETLVKQGLVTKHYRHEGNDKKYPVMREMFWDASHPITTNWVVWFDDDSIADRRPDWLVQLTKTIIQYRPQHCHMYGAKFIWALQAGQAQWYRSRPWYKQRPFRERNGKPSPNGNKIHFATGGFWALSVEALRACNIPDPELGHNGGDYTIGEQLYQSGFGLKSWNGDKQFVHTSSVPRRGLSEKHPGQK